MKKLVDKIFERYINTTFGMNEAVKTFLLKHEKRPLLINNLLKEINRLEHSAIKTNTEHIELVVGSFAAMFARAALLSKEQSLMSESEQIRQTREREQDQLILNELERSDSESKANIEHFNS